MHRKLNEKTTKQLLALSAGIILAFSLAVLPASFGSQKAYAHGTPPGYCGNEYDYTLEYFTIDNGVHTFDLLAEQGHVFLFNANNGGGYDVSFDIHSASQSREGNTQNGSIWYNHNAYGYGWGACAYNIFPDQDVTVDVDNIVSAQAFNNPSVDEDNLNLGPIPWSFSYGETNVQYLVNWYTPEGIPADTGTSKVTIMARNDNASYSNMDGMYVNLTSNGQLIDSGFTPVTFTLENGKEYEIGAANYGPYHFYHWSVGWNWGAILPIKVAETTEAVIIADYVTKEEQPTETASTTSELTVNTKDGTSGNTVNGYWTVLSKDGNTVATGFSPATFTLDNNENYVVSVADYGQYVFDHWQDTGFTARDRSISISSDTDITAVYRNVNSPQLEQPPDEETPPDEEPPSSGQSSVTVRSIDRNSGNQISGYYTTLFDGSGNAIQTGFTPATFDLTAGQQYTVEVQDYGSYYFNYWQDDSSTSRDRTFTASDSGQILTAIYSTSPSASPPSDDEEEQPPMQTTGTISVTTVDPAGNEIYGYYTTLSENGNVIQTAFSPAEFTVNTGQTYQVAVADYGQYVFDHWSNGSTGRLHDAQAGDSLTAVYRN